LRYARKGKAVAVWGIRVDKGTTRPNIERLYELKSKITLLACIVFYTRFKRAGWL
jgi:hypothetical protein